MKISLLSLDVLIQVFLIEDYKIGNLDLNLSNVGVPKSTGVNLSIHRYVH